MGDDRDTALGAFGRWLAQERELRGLARDEVARATKLGPGTVDALESGERERMPPRAYVLGYLRSYASAVGLDADDVVLRFEEAAGAPEATTLGRRRRARASTAIALAIALAVVAAGVWALLAR